MSQLAGDRSVQSSNSRLGGRNFQFLIELHAVSARSVLVPPAAAVTPDDLDVRAVERYLELAAAATRSETGSNIDDLANRFGMSASDFHHHFKSVTAMSPVQFQKRIGHQEARRLMLGEELDAANAGFRVGYEDPSYFSREYRKLFGAPPQPDIARLRSSLQLQPFFSRFLGSGHNHWNEIKQLDNSWVLRKVLATFLNPI